MPLSRELKFTETRPLPEFTLTAIGEGIAAAFAAARAEGAPERPGVVSLQVTGAIGSGSLYTMISWGAKLEFEEPARAGD